MNGYRIPGRRAVEIVKDELLGDGMEGEVYPIADNSAVCAKIYTSPHDDVIDRVAALVGLPPARWDGDHPAHFHVAWPQAPLVDERGRPCGFVMPRIAGLPLEMLGDARGRHQALLEPTWRELLVIAARVAHLFDMLHDVGVVVGDVSLKNVMVTPTGHVTLVDCDTVQFTAPGGRLFRTPKFTPEYAPPEADQLVHRPSTPAQDSFGLAIMICWLLMEGQNPFAGVLTDPSLPDDVQQNVMSQNNRLLWPDRFVPMEGELPVEVLPPEILALARRCFADGHHDPAARPRPGEWVAALNRAQYRLMGCRENPMHFYSASLPSCVWCARIAGGLLDEYPPRAPLVPSSPAAPVPQPPSGAPAPALPGQPGLRTARVVAIALLLVLALAIILAVMSG
ncbi:protein kinase domain-containing protein [[Actinomadura] parvosata]|uniref:protein kinase domain-containing protein n=1 Tax=[Actinomadura] parvosata TaxID=1955412 RepID=UPI00406CE081